MCVCVCVPSIRIHFRSVSRYCWTELNNWIDSGNLCCSTSDSHLNDTQHSLFNEYMVRSTDNKMIDKNGTDDIIATFHESSNYIEHDAVCCEIVDLCCMHACLVHSPTTNFIQCESTAFTVILIHNGASCGLQFVEQNNEGLCRRSDCKTDDMLLLLPLVSCIACGSGKVQIWKYRLAIEWCICIFSGNEQTAANIGFAIASIESSDMIDNGKQPFLHAFVRKCIP